jgi:hypothetical protein
MLVMACGKAEGIPTLVSVVIPARNAADVLGGQLKALSGQNWLFVSERGAPL